MHCDFCFAEVDTASEDVYVWYCEPFTLEESNTTDYQDDGQWAACRDCHLLLFTGRNTELVGRIRAGAEREAERVGTDIGVAGLNALLKMFAAFLEHRIGAYGVETPEPADDGTLTTWVIFDHPRDFPDYFVLRPQYVNKDSHGRIGVGIPRFANSLEEARGLLPQGLYCIERFPTDDPKIVESWV